MESSSKSAASGSGSRSKVPGIPPSTRIQRNLAEKERRDKLNGFISELANLIPMVSNAVKPLDKVSILRLAAAEMRLHFSCLNPKKYKKKPLVLPPAIMGSLDLIEKTTGGFVMVTTLTGVIVFCSRSIEDYLGYQNIDVMGNKAVKYIYEADTKYFESKFSSVVNSLRKASKRKTKVFKSHMLQKPLPRSSETCRPRNMIFKFSVHQNDTSGHNGSSNGTAKNQPQKDFGYSAVVLMFIEPVRFEPEVDITYIDINQDVYFTRHGLHGEIIYADQRISTITGYMSHDVQGTSAYKYISNSDIPLAMFAQKAMFTSTDGKGVIVYRLRIRDMRCIYLQSSGEIVYKDSSNEISHFVCFNRLLSEEEGSQELKKFQLRYAPQIMAAKMLQVQKNPGNQSPTTDLAYEQVMKLLNPSSNIDSPSSVQSNSLTYSNTSTPDEFTSTADKRQREVNASPSSFSIEPNCTHSLEDPSTVPINNDLSRPIPLNHSSTYEKDMEVILEIPGQRLGGGPLRRRDSSISSSSSPYKAVTNDKKGKILTSEQLKNCLNKVDPVDINENFYSENNPNTNGTKQFHQNSQYITIKSQNRAVHFVNVNNNMFSDSNGFGGAHNSHSTVFDPALSQKITLQLTAPVPHFNGQSNGPITDLSEQHSEYLRYKEKVSVNNQPVGGSFEAVPNVLYNQLDFNEEQNSLSQISPIEDTSQIYDASSVSSLQKNSNLPVLSDLYNNIDQCHNFNSYSDIDSCNNYQFPSSINNYNNGANISVHNDFGNFNSETYTVGEMNGIYEAITSLNKLKSIPSLDIVDSMKTSVEIPSLWGVPQKLLHNKVDFMDINTSTTISTKTIDFNQNNCVNTLSTNSGHELSPSVICSDILSGSMESEDVSLNKELYSELNLFFQNLSELNTSQSSAIIKEISEFPVDSFTYSLNGASSESKTFYQ